MSKVLKVAIAGQGRSGYDIHFQTLLNMPDKFEIVAVADELPERLKEADAIGAFTAQHYSELLERGGFDLFVNALPTPFHKDGTLAALAKGHHVVCEKPLAPTVADFDDMCAAADKAGTIFAPFQQSRFQPFYLKLQEILKSGVLGELVHIRSNWSAFSRRWDWQTFQENIGGGLYNTGPHAVDQIIGLLGADKEMDVFCRMDSKIPFDGDADNFCVLTLFGKDIPHVDITISSFAAYSFGPRYSISGTCGGLTGGERNMQWKYFDPEKAPKQEMWEPWSKDRAYPREELPWIEEEWKLDEEDMDRATGYTLVSLPSAPESYYINIYAAITEGADLIVEHADVRKQLEIIEESHRQNSMPKNESYVTPQLTWK